jgi:putative ABC transport system substrate-binding protein
LIHWLALEGEMSILLRRRDFIAGLGGAAVWPFAAGAQQPERMRRIGVLLPYLSEAINATFRGELRKLGWVDARNLRIDSRDAGGDGSRLRTYAAELVAMAPEVILAAGTPAAIALQQQTGTIPIVFATVADPIVNGLVTSVARPGGNITGFANNEQTIAAKYLELLKQIAPRVTRVAFVYDPANPNWSGSLAVLKAAAPLLGVQLSEAALREVGDIERTIDAFAREGNGGLIVKASPIPNLYRTRLIARAAQHSLPAVYEFRTFVAAGGLLSYGIDPDEPYRGAAGYVDRILRGEKPGDLPVQFPTKFEMVLNLKTAKALGLTVPPTLFALADEVIE